MQEDTGLLDCAVDCRLYYLVCIMIVEFHIIYCMRSKKEDFDIQHSNQKYF